MGQKKLAAILVGILLILGIALWNFRNCEAVAVGGFVGIRNECRSEFQCISKQGWKHDTCYEGVASYTRDINLCNKILDSSIKNLCIANVAGYLKDKSLCSRINLDTPGGHRAYDDCQNGTILSY